MRNETRRIWGGKFWYTALVLSLVLSNTSPLAADVLYSVTDIGRPGDPAATGFAINNAGQVVGTTNYSGAFNAPPRAFLYSNGQITDLAFPGDSSSYGYGVNNAGQVVGYSYTLFGHSHAFLYSDGQITDLGISDGISYAEPRAINDRGQVAGYFNASNGATHAFLYSNGQVTDLGALPGFDQSRASAINNSGQVVGWSYNNYADPSAAHAFLYSDGQMRDLGAGNALAINDLGQVTGRFINSNGDSHAFLYSNGQMTDLGVLAGRESSGEGINNAGQVVGSSVSVAGFFPPIIDSAFLYSNGQMRNLNTLIDPALYLGLNEATAINDHGQILANGNGRAYLLTPIPEPSTLALFGVVLLGCSIWARCSQKHYTAPVLHK
ncbi:MAG: PEP-CTERM sorting domain-containing protein [Acidobacteriaceae bacterium]|nr:PEP-CTERM sorting domain-containing protein [Acidobacteriaceae bacterium]MBV9307995.1 PEP-CTERM sorting domain-containing protein [Acidobacteriaceae bacterium]